MSMNFLSFIVLIFLSSLCFLSSFRLVSWLPTLLRPYILVGKFLWRVRISLNFIFEAFYDETLLFPQTFNWPWNSLMVIMAYLSYILAEVRIKAIFFSFIQSELFLNEFDCMPFVFLSVKNDLIITLGKDLLGIHFDESNWKYMLATEDEITFSNMSNYFFLLSFELYFCAQGWQELYAFISSSFELHFCAQGWQELSAYLYGKASPPTLSSQ